MQAQLGRCDAVDRIEGLPELTTPTPMMQLAGQGARLHVERRKPSERAVPDAIVRLQAEGAPDAAGHRPTQRVPLGHGHLPGPQRGRDAGVRRSRLGSRQDETGTEGQRVGDLLPARPGGENLPVLVRECDGKGEGGD